MPSFSDLTNEPFDFDWDITPEEEMEDEGYGYDGIDDYWEEEQEDWDGHIYHQPTEDDPGAGDSYQGTDPTVFDEQDQLSDEETATIPDAVDQSFGSADDPEAQEHPGDEAVGDDEDDNSDPAQIYESPAPDQDEDLKSDINTPDQGQAAQETTARSPIRPTIEYDDLLDELMEAARPKDWSEDWPHPPRESVSDAVPSNVVDTDVVTTIDFYSLASELTNEVEGWNAALVDGYDNLQAAASVTEEQMFWSELENNILITEIDVYGIVTDEYGRGSRGNEQFGYFMTPYSTDDMVETGFDEGFDLLIPMNTIDFMDVIGSIEIETMLTEFQLIEQDEV